MAHPRNGLVMSETILAMAIVRPRKSSVALLDRAQRGAAVYQGLGPGVRPVAQLDQPAPVGLGVHRPEHLLEADQAGKRGLGRDLPPP